MGKILMTRNHAEFGTIKWALAFGKTSASTIRSIRASGYSKARRCYNFYSDKRYAHAAAMRALSAVTKLGNPRPYYIERTNDTGRLYALSWMESLEQKHPVYHYMRDIGRRQRLHNPVL